METYADAFGHSMSEADLRAHLEAQLAPAAWAEMLGRDVVLLAAEGDRLVGFVQFGAARSGSGTSDQELRRIYVHRDFQNRGHGTALMERALDHPQLRSAGSIQLDVWEHNRGAQRFYARYGFRVAGERRFETASGATPGLDLVMVRTRPERP